MDGFGKAGEKVAMRLNRRTLLAALPLAAACSGAARARVLYVTPDGDGDGGDWDNAASIGDLDGLIARAGAGGEILIAAERGAYAIEEPIWIGAGGRSGARVRVRGVHSETGAPMAAQIVGDRTEEEVGTDAFRLARHADHLHFSHFAFARIGNGCFRAAATLRDLVIEDCSFENIYRFLENTVDDGRVADIRGFAVRRCSGSGVERGFLRVRYASSAGVLEDCSAVGVPAEGDEVFPAGCALDDRARDITYRRCVMRNFQQLRAGDYWNGDGFSCEPDNRGIVYEDCIASGSTDGGFDCKSRNVVLRRCTAEDNKRNFRIWSANALMQDCISREPNFRGENEEETTPAHIWIGDENARVRIERLTIEDADAGTQLFEIDYDDARVDLSGLTLRAPSENWGDEAERIRELVRIAG
jgi:hypothetical protein